MRSSLVAAGAFAVLFISASARAGDGEQARAAYESGDAAYKKGDYAAAATSLALADEIAPNPVALEAALKAVIRTGDAALGMDLAERAEQRSGGPALADLARRAREQFASLAGRITARCPPDRACSAAFAGRPLVIGKPRWIAAGDRVVEFTIDGKTTLEALRVEAGASVEIAPRAAPPPAPVAAPPSPAIAALPVAAPPVAAPPVVAPPVVEKAPSGISPAWFIASAVVTAGLGAGAAASGADTLSQHQAFIAGPTGDGATAGQAAQLRTNVLFVSAGVAAAATAAIGLFAVRWSSPGRGAGKGPSSLTVAASGAGLCLSGQY